MAKGSGPTKLNIARWSYAEVLDATKHQDDKIGRFLSAIAFLVAGALAFGTNSKVLGAHLQLGHHRLQLPAIALGLFLVFATLSAMLFILATSEPLTVPGSSSHLFFLAIARQGLGKWQQSWTHPTLAEDLEDEFILESWNIAQRATEKYRRCADASAVFIVALVFFMVGLLFSIEALAGSLAWSLRLRTETGTLLGLFALVLVSGGPGRSRRAGSAVLLYPVSIFLVVFLNGGFPAMYLLLSVLLALTVVVYPSLSRKPRAGGVAALWLGLGGLAAVGTASADWQLLAGIVAAILPLAYNFRPPPATSRGGKPVDGLEDTEQEAR